MNHSKIWTVCCIGAIITTGCATAPEEPTPAKQTNRLTGISTSIVPGFRHDATKTLFAFGGSLSVDSRVGATRTVGTSGVFAVFDNGLSMGVPNADSPAEKVGPFGSSVDAHNALVLQYFKDSGLPTDQIGDLHGHAMVDEVGKVGVPTSPVRTLRAFTTIVDRRVSGARVEGSYAWARFNAAKEAVSEEVYWPELPGSILDDLVAFRTTLSSSDAKTAYMAHLPPELLDETGELVIHHSSPWEAERTATVTLDFHDRSRPSTMSFDISGREITPQTSSAATTKK